MIVSGCDFHWQFLPSFNLLLLLAATNAQQTRLRASVAALLKSSLFYVYSTCCHDRGILRVVASGEVLVKQFAQMYAGVFFDYGLGRLIPLLAVLQVL